MMGFERLWGRYDAQCFTFPHEALPKRPSSRRINAALAHATFADFSACLLSLNLAVFKVNSNFNLRVVSCSA
jgi:hypothetical protein